MKRFMVYFSIAYLMLYVTACSSGSQAGTSPTQIKNDQTNTPASTTISSPEPSSTVEPKPSELIEVDSDWNQYTNYRLGFTMLVPKSMFHGSASCYWNEEDGDFSYRLQPGKAPVVVIEGNDRVYITSKYMVSLSEPTAIPSGQGYKHTFGGCEWIKNDLDAVANREYSSYIWEIAVRPINSEQDLENLVDNYYGECFSVGQIKPVEDKEYSLVHIVGDQKPIEESTCLLRGMYIFLYSQEYQVAATWNTGQMVHFSASGPNEDPLDEIMYDSFQFIPNNHNE